MTKVINTRHRQLFADNVDSKIEKLDGLAPNKAEIINIVKSNFWELAISQEHLQILLDLQCLLTSDPITVMGVLGDNSFSADDIISLQEEV